MATIRSAIQVTDGMSPAFRSMTNALNIVLNTFESLQTAVSSPIDTAGIDAARAEINKIEIAAMAAEEHMAKLNRVAVAPGVATPPEIHVTWKSEDMPVFTGADRLGQEVRSANNMLATLRQTQERIAAQASSMDVFSPDAIDDLTSIQDRVKRIATAIGQIEANKNPMNVETANADLERLRGQLSQAVRYQDQLNQAVRELDVGEANQAYNRLSATISSAERYIRDNPVEVPVVWKTEDMPVFTGVGMDRFEQEIGSANTMLTALQQKQEQIAAQAGTAGIFSPGAVADLTTVQERVQRIRSAIERIENNPANKSPVNVGTANAELERLRGQLSQAIQYQDQLNKAVQRMDVGEANQAYNRLTATIGNTERYIRDNVDEQGRFNSQISKGARAAEGLWSKIRGIAMSLGAAFGAKKVVDMTDDYTNQSARLGLINDGLQTQAELQQKIFASAQRSRGEYGQMVGTVAKLGLLAKDAFQSNDEVIAFGEIMNKAFRVSGASASEATNGMYQLTQAMAAGRLQGDEFRSVMENAPMVAQAIAQYTGKSMGELKQMSADGVITSDIIKNALFSAADDINAKFETMPATFETVWTSIKNKAVMQFSTIMQKINGFLNSDTGARVIEGVTSAMGALTSTVGFLLGLVMSVTSFFTANWPLIAPIVWGLVGAFVAYNAVALVTNGILAVQAIQKSIAAAGTMLLAGETFTATVAQHGLNAALYACPLTWIIVSIIAIIALFYVVIGAINTVAGTSISATGIIFGAFAVLGAFLWDLFLGVFDLVLGVINALVNPFIRFANFIGNIFTNPISAIIYGFQSMADGILAILQKVASAMDFVFGSHMAETVGDWRAGLKDMADAAVAEYAPNENYQKIMSELDLSVDDLGLKRVAYSDAWKAGYNTGDKIANSFNLAGAFDANQFGSTFDDLLKGVNTTSDNTGAMADSMDITEEDLKYLRDLAEQEVVNRFTTAEIKVDMTNHNSISSNMDLDGVVGYLEEKIYETMETAAEGVHG